MSEQHHHNQPIIDCLNKGLIWCNGPNLNLLATHYSVTSNVPPGDGLYMFKNCITIKLLLLLLRTHLELCVFWHTHYFVTAGSFQGFLNNVCWCQATHLENPRPKKYTKNTYTQTYTSWEEVLNSGHWPGNLVTCNSTTKSGKLRKCVTWTWYDTFGTICHIAYDMYIWTYLVFAETSPTCVHDY